MLRHSRTLGQEHASVCDSQRLRSGDTLQVPSVSLLRNNKFVQKTSQKSKSQTFKMLLLKSHNQSVGNDLGVPKNFSRSDFVSLLTHLEAALLQAFVTVQLISRLVLFPVSTARDFALVLECESQSSSLETPHEGSLPSLHF